MNKVDTMAKKSSPTQIVIRYRNIIGRRYDFKVTIIHTDGEMSLGGEFKEWTAERGITLERSDAVWWAARAHNCRPENEVRK